MSWLSEAPVRLTGNRARPGDSDYGQSSNPADFEKKHPRAATGAMGGGRFVSKGSTGADVKTVQRALGQPQSGTFHEGMVATVMDFQRRHGLAVDGIVGRQTALALAGHEARARRVRPGALTHHSLQLLRQAHQPAGGRSSLGTPKPRAARRVPAGNRAGGGFLVERDVEVDVPLRLVEGRAESFAWDEALHPRDLLGRFAEKVGGLRTAQAVQLPDGTRVTMHRDGRYRVARSGRIVAHDSAEAAAADAVNRSARGREDVSIGGATRHANFDAYLRSRSRGNMPPASPGRDPRAGGTASVPAAVATPAPLRSVTVPGAASVTNPAARSVLERIATAEGAQAFRNGTGTDMVQVAHAGSHLHVRGGDGRVWSVDVAQARQGRFNQPGTVQVRTTGGAAYTAPAMGTFLQGRLGGRPPAAGVGTELIPESRAVPAFSFPAVGAPLAAAAAARTASASRAPAAPAAPQVAIGPAPRAGDPRVQAIVDSLHGFTDSGLTTKILVAAHDGFAGHVLNASGVAVGSFSRRLNYKRDGSPSYVYHSIFTISGDYRATGYGSKLIDRMFDAYREGGFREVRVSAGLSAGGYQWAKMGFELTTVAADRPREVADFVRRSVGYRKIDVMVREGNVPEALAEEFKRQLEAGLITSMAQVAAWGRRTQWEARSEGRTHKFWLGKALLLGASWSGVKTL